MTRSSRLARRLSTSKTAALPTKEKSIPRWRPTDDGLVAPCDSVFRDALGRLINLTLDAACIAAEQRVRAKHFSNPSVTPDDLEHIAALSLRNQAQALVCAIEDLGTCREALYFMLSTVLARFVPAIVANATMARSECQPLSLIN